MAEKKLTMPVAAKWALLEPDHPELSLRRRCALLELNRASHYYQAEPEDRLNLELIRKMDEQYLKTPCSGWPQMTAALRAQGDAINGKRVHQLMRQMGIQAVMLRKRRATSTPGHRIYPYLLRERGIDTPNQVWSADITYVPMPRGCLYLVAMMDWFSRYVRAWEISNRLEGGCCCSALERALQHGTPTIFNTDRAVNLPRRPSRRAWRRLACRSVWMAAGGSAPTAVSSGAGGASRTRISISTTIRRFPP